MTTEQKLNGIAKHLQEFVDDTDNLIESFFEPNELSEIKGARRLALEILIKFHLEENL